MRLSNLLLLPIVALFALSCSTVRYVPEERYLLDKVEVRIDNPAIGKDEIKVQIRQKENYKILGFIRFHLWLYNLSSKNREESWLKRIGEGPEIFDEGLVFASEERIKQYLGNRGFFNASVVSDIKLNEQRRSAKVRYNVATGIQYTIREVNYHIEDSALNRIFFRDSLRTLIRPGAPFDFNKLDKHRSLIVDLYKNEGYFYFSKDDVSFLADSIKYDKEIVLDLFVGAGEGRQSHFRQYRLNHFYTYVLPGSVSLSDIRPGFGNYSDTLRWRNYTLYQNPDITYRPGLFRNMMQMRGGSLYRQDDARRTFDSFNRLRQFRFIDIQFNQPEMMPDSNLLNCHIRLAPMSKQAVSFDVEGTNTSGNLGVAGNVSYQHRNVFRGAEAFQLNFKGAVERQQRMVDNVSEYFNTREFGTEATLTIPKAIGPRQVSLLFRNYLLKTVVTVGYNFQRRPEYTRTIANVKFGYDWSASDSKRHTWNLVDFNMINLSRFDPEFIDLIRDLYIKSSFSDHLILATSYSYVYNTQKPGSRQNYSYLRFNSEAAGNLLYLLSGALKREEVVEQDDLSPWSFSYYQLLNTRFAQYLKGDIELRKGYILNKYSSVTGRVFFGMGLPYGNLDLLPFEKKYFTGGANGIRAWQVRSLGPGTFRMPENAYPNQSGDIKLEGNLEYRFNLIGFLEGALFLDAGNIWAINRKDNRPGAQFKFNSFYKQIALGTGTGFRFDFNFFIFRFDIGMKLRDPSEVTNNGWIIGNRKYSGDDFNFSFAIGYPF